MGGLFAAAILFAVSLQACLTSGSGGGSPEPEPVDYVALGNEYYRQGQFGAAMGAYDSALLQDSSLSMAYYGYAKAVLMFYGVRGSDILADMEATSEDPSRFAFLDHPDSILTARLQGTGAARRMLRQLVDRDTLTRWWKYTDNVVTPEESADSLYAARRAFMIDYFTKADLGVSGYRKAEKFPLTDFKMRRESILLDFTVIEMTYTITRLYDLDWNDTIDVRDSLMKKLQFGGSGGFGLDSLSDLDLENDSGAVQNLNELILGMQSGLLNTSDLANLIKPDSGNDSGSARQEANQNIDSIIASLGDAVLFYQFGDKKDNDGDGCIDEEILDEKDNDGDGFVDEDARVIPPNKPDGVDNDHDGRKDPVNPPIGLAIGNDSLGREDTVGTARNAAKPWLLGFVHAFEAANPDSPFIKIRKGDANLDLRVAIQKDSLATKSPSDLAGPFKAKLDSAKALVGGCWRNYP